MANKNPLLDNMKNKVQTIDGATDMLLKLMNGQKVVLKGIHDTTIYAPQTEQAYKKNIEVFQKLQEERENLVKRIRWIEPFY